MSLSVIVISIVIPAACLVLSEILRKNSRQYSDSIRNSCRTIKRFSKNLEDSTKEIGRFDAASEKWIVKGDLSCEHVNEEAGKKTITGDKLDWYAHTRYHYFNPAREPDADRNVTSGNWLRRQLRNSLSSIGEETPEES